MKVLTHYKSHIAKLEFENEDLKRKEVRRDLMVRGLFSRIERDVDLKALSSSGERSTVISIDSSASWRRAGEQPSCGGELRAMLLVFEIANWGKKELFGTNSR